MKSLKHALANRDLTIGSWVSFGFTPTTEMMARAGFDWLVIDMEHTAIGVSDAQQLIQVIDLAGVVPLVRVGANDPLLIKRAMDSGAHGVIVPMVNSADEAKRAVQALYYPPIGNRGAGLARAQGYGLEFTQYKEWADRESVLIVQIEHVDAVNQLEEIISVDGVDGFIVGPYDLSGSLGMPGRWNEPAVVEALAEVERVIALDLKPAGYHVVHSNSAELQLRIRQGYRFIAYGDDMVFFAEKLNEERQVVHESLMARIA